MITLITGGADSGKSEYAEELLMRESGGAKRIYMATMKREAAAMERIERHIKRRAGRGFFTVECGDAPKLAAPEGEAFLLFEDVPNFVANVMFGSEKEDFFNRICNELDALMEGGCHIYFVTGDIASSGGNYGKLTLEYMRLLGRVQQYLGRKSDRVIEVVAGIPCIIKERTKYDSNSGSR